MCKFNVVSKFPFMPDEHKNEELQNRILILEKEIKYLKGLINKSLSVSNNSSAITESKLKNLIQSNDKLLSIISHDLKSPFGSVVGLTDMVIENLDNYPPEEVLKIFGLVNSSARFALELLDNLLNWARSQTGKITVTPSLFYLYQVINETVSLLEGMATNKDIIVNITVNEAIKVNADPNWTKIILRNLISNAIKYTNKNGKIIVSAKDVGDYIEITVADNGVGISSDDISKLFQINVKFLTLGTANEKGSGIGLLLCKEFVERQGGKICVESKLSEGTQLKITLPKG